MQGVPEGVKCRQSSTNRKPVGNYPSPFCESARARFAQSCAPMPTQRWTLKPCIKADHKQCVWVWASMIHGFQSCT